LVWCGLKQAENEPKTSYARKAANQIPVPEFIDPVLGMKVIVFTKTSPKRSFVICKKMFLSISHGQWTMDMLLKLFTLVYFSSRLILAENRLAG
jgi:hypothetical protein